MTKTTTRSTLRVALPDGREATRTTARVYTHMVALWYEHSREGWRWDAYSWCGSAALAEKRSCEALRNHGAGSKTTILPVVPA